MFTVTAQMVEVGSQLVLNKKAYPVVDVVHCTGLVRVIYNRNGRLKSLPYASMDEVRILK